MRSGLGLWLVLMIAIPGGCGSARQPVGPGDLSDGAPASDASATDTSASTQPCSRWRSDLQAQNILDINRLGLYLSHAVAQGRLGQAIKGNNEWFAPLAIQTIWYGPQFLEGFTVWVPLDASEVEHLDLPGDYIVGFGGNAYPIDSDQLEGAVWWHTNVIIDADQRERYGRFVGYHSSRSSHIGVVKIASQNEWRTRLQLVKAISGKFPSSLISVAWSTSAYPVPFPVKTDQEYIVSFASMAYYESTGEHGASIEDFRANTPQNLALVRQELSAPVSFWNPQQMKAFKDTYRTSWTFRRAPHVLSTEVSGTAEECCTGAGGRYIAHRIVDTLQGQLDRTHLVTGGHGYYGPEACGDTFLLAAFDLDDSDPYRPEEFACDTSGVVGVMGSGYPYMGGRTVQLEGTPAARQELETWLASAEPLLRIYPPDRTLSAEHLSQDGGGGLWSEPVVVEDAIAAGTHPIRFKIESVKQHRDPDWYEITISTNFSTYAPDLYDHLKMHRVKLAFECGDERLLQQGSTWLGLVVFDEPVYLQDPEQPAYESAFMVPGVLLPDLDYMRRIVEQVPYAMSTKLTE